MVVRREKPVPFFFFFHFYIDDLKFLLPIGRQPPGYVVTLRTHASAASGLRKIVYLEST